MCSYKKYSEWLYEGNRYDKGKQKGADFLIACTCYSSDAMRSLMDINSSEFDPRKLFGSV